MSGRECTTCDRTQKSWKIVLSSSWLPRLLRLNIVKTTMWQAFLWSSSVWTTIKAQRDKIASWSARMVANVNGVKIPPGMELGQWWRLWHRTGHRWIKKCSMNVLVAIRNRLLSWAGHMARLDYKDICAKALRCRGLQWWRWRQLNWKEVERDKWSGPHPQRFKIYRWEDMVAGEVSKFVGNADGMSKTVQDNTGWLHFAQNRGSCNFRNVERALYRWSRVLRGRKRVRHDWDDCSGCLDDREKDCEGEIWRAHATPLSSSYSLRHSRKYAPMSNGPDNRAERKC